MKSTLVILICLLSFGAFAQDKATTASNNCLQEWYTLFKERGAKPVPNGPQEIIITLQHKDYSECFMGKIDVMNEKLSGKLLVQKMDGTYAEFDKKVSAGYQKDGVLKDELREINNGMSVSLTLSDGENIRLFFYKSLADKPKANKKAGSPADLIKN